MIVRIDDWIFDVDVDATAKYSAREAEQHCDCANCRNFYAAVDAYYPELRPFLTQFGLQVEAPDRMSPIDISIERIDYDPMYYVFGRILQQGRFEIPAGTANVAAFPLDECYEGREVFELNVFEVSLPWVLEEPFEGIQTTDEPSILQKMVDLVLGHNKKDPYVN